MRKGTSDYAATLSAGTDYYFTNGRVHPYTEDQSRALINAPAVMPPDTQYEDQIQTTNRLGAARWKSMKENGNSPTTSILPRS